MTAGYGPLRGVGGGSTPSRIDLIGAVDDASATRVVGLLATATEGLRAAYLPRSGTFAQTVRGLPGRTDVQLRTEGTSLRYAAIAALGLARLPESEQRRVLHGRTAHDLARRVADSAEHDPDPGAAALGAWASVEVNDDLPSALLRRCRDLVDADTALPTVALAWLLTAAVAANPMADTDAMVLAASQRLRRCQGHEGCFPHVTPPVDEAWWRRHVGSFADNIYPVQALARAAEVTASADLLTAANRTAHRLCALQGPAGQWWWHYDARNGSVVERYPVYSVHQHAMAPMALLDLQHAGGDDHRDSIVAGLGWLDRHPEVVEDLIERAALAGVAQGRPPRATQGRPRPGGARDRAAPRVEPPGAGPLVPPHRGRPRVPALRARVAALRLAAREEEGER